MGKINQQQAVELLNAFAENLGGKFKALEDKIAETKREILGGENLDQSLDTIKEIAEEFKAFKNGNAAAQALEKINELTRKVTDLESRPQG